MLKESVVDVSSSGRGGSRGTRPWPSHICCKKRGDLDLIETTANSIKAITFLRREVVNTSVWSTLARCGFTLERERLGGNVYLT